MWLLLLACAPAIECPDGYAAATDGLCYPESAEPVATADDLVASLPACMSAGEGDGRLELASGCVEDACVGDSYAQVSEALGEDGEVIGWGTFDDNGDVVFAFVDWSVGISTWFPAIPAGDDEYVPDPDAPGTWPLFLDPAYDGRTGDGLGVDSELSCWLERLGPAALSYTFDGGWHVERAFWADPAVMLYTDPGPPFSATIWGDLPW